MAGVDTGWGVAAQAFAFLKKRPLHSKVIPLPEDQETLQRSDEPSFYSSIQDRSETGSAESVVGGAMQAILSGELIKIFNEIDDDGDGLISYAGFIDKMKKDRDLARRLKIRSSRDAVEYANRIWNGKFGRTLSGDEMEEALFGRPPGTTMFETYSITWDIRARLTVSRDDFLRHHQKLGPAVVAPPMDESVRPEKGHPQWQGLMSDDDDDDDDDAVDGHEDSGDGDWQAALRRSQEEEVAHAGSEGGGVAAEVCVDLHCPARVGLRVRTSEWFKRSRGKYGWPDESMGTVGTITRVCRVKDVRSWHFSTCPLIKSSTAADLTIGDGIDKKSFHLMRQRGTHKHWGSLPEKDPRGRISKILGDSVFHTQNAPLSSTNTARPQAHLHGTDRVYQTHERLKLHKELFLDPWPLGGLVFSEVPADKPFSSTTAQYWSMPHGWGLKHSQHWSNPGRNFAFPDVAAMECQDAGFEEDEGRLVAFVEWDCGSCGEYSLFECPYGDASLGFRALLVKHHKFSPPPSLLAPFCPRPVALDMCSQSRYTSPNVFVVDAVGSDGRWELAYSCCEDAYVHTSWLVHASGGGTSMSIRRGFRAGVCHAGNVERRRGKDSAAGSMQAWAARAALAERQSEGGERASGEAGSRAELHGGNDKSKRPVESQRVVTVIEDAAAVQSSVTKAKAAPTSGPCVHVADTASGGCVVWGFSVQQIYAHSHADAIEELRIGCRHIVSRAADVSFFLESVHQPGERHALSLPKNGDTLDVSALVRGWRGFFVRAELECRAGFNAGDSALLFGSEDDRGGCHDLTVHIQLKKAATGTDKKLRSRTRPQVRNAEAVRDFRLEAGEDVDEERRAGAALRDLRDFQKDGERADEDVSRLVEVFSVLERACSLEGVRAFVCRLGGPEMIASVMSARKGDVGVQRNACSALGSMASVLGVVGSAGGRASHENPLAEALQRDGSGGGWIIRSVLEAMKGHRQDAVLQEHGCAFVAGVASMACSPLPDRSEAAQMRALQSPDVGGKRPKGSDTLSGDSNWSAVVMSEECLESVVRAMRAHLGVPAVQHRGCNAVWALLREGVCRTARLAGSLEGQIATQQEVVEEVESGDDKKSSGSASDGDLRSACTGALLSALCRHKGDEAVCSKASWALWEVCGGRHMGTSLSVDSKVPFGAALLTLKGVLPPSPADHRGKHTPQREALFQPHLAPLSLSALRASLTHCKDRSADREAAEACLAAMQAWQGSEDVQEEGCALLASLSAKAVHSQGGLRAVVRALRRHRGVDSVVIQGFRVVRLVASSKALMNDVSQAGCLGEVCESARAHLASEDVVRGALRVLGEISATKEGADDVAVLAIIPTLEAAARKYRHGVEVLLRSVKLKMQDKGKKPILVRTSVHSKRTVGGSCGTRPEGGGPRNGNYGMVGSGGLSCHSDERTRLEVMLFEGRA